MGLLVALGLKELQGLMQLPAKGGRLSGGRRARLLELGALQHELSLPCCW